MDVDSITHQLQEMREHLAGMKSTGRYDWAALNLIRLLVYGYLRRLCQDNITLVPPSLLKKRHQAIFALLELPQSEAPWEERKRIVQNAIDVMEKLLRYC